MSEKKIINKKENPTFKQRRWVKKDGDGRRRDFRAGLKVKIKSLAAEAKMIRLEEIRTPSYWEYLQLNAHRRVEVRREARAAQLAYGFLRGRDYLTLEPGAKNEPDWDRVERLVKKFWRACVYYGFKPASDEETAELEKRWQDWWRAGAAKFEEDRDRVPEDVVAQASM